MLCGKCNQPAENHPHEHCPYVLEVIGDGKGQIVGYKLQRKPKQENNGKAAI